MGQCLCFWNESAIISKKNQHLTPFVCLFNDPCMGLRSTAVWLYHHQLHSHTNVPSLSVAKTNTKANVSYVYVSSNLLFPPIDCFYITFHSCSVYRGRVCGYCSSINICARALCCRTCPERISPCLFQRTRSVPPLCSCDQWEKC